MLDEHVITYMYDLHLILDVQMHMLFSFEFWAQMTNVR